MSITYWCGNCDRRYVVPEELAGKRVRCKSCGHDQHVVDAANALSHPSVYDLGAEPVSSPPPSRPAVREPRPVEIRGTTAAKPFRLAILEESQVQGLAVCLLLLSVGDLFMTFALLEKHPAFFESNPVAQWFFARWDMMGMALFKFSVIGFAIALSEVIERRRPGWGQFVLVVGCSASAYAIYKGYALFHGPVPGVPMPLD